MYIILLFLYIYCIMIVQSYRFAYQMKQKRLVNCLMNMLSNKNNVFVFSLSYIRIHLHLHTGRTRSIYCTGTHSR